MPDECDDLHDLMLEKSDMMHGYDLCDDLNVIIGAHVVGNGMLKTMEFFFCDRASCQKVVGCCTSMISQHSF